MYILTYIFTCFLYKYIISCGDVFRQIFSIEKRDARVIFDFNIKLSYNISKDRGESKQ